MTGDRGERVFEDEVTVGKKDGIMGEGAFGDFCLRDLNF